MSINRDDAPYRQRFARLFPAGPAERPLPAASIISNETETNPASPVIPLELDDNFIQGPQVHDDYAGHGINQTEVHRPIGTPPPAGAPVDNNPSLATIPPVPVRRNLAEAGLEPAGRSSWSPWEPHPTPTAEESSAESNAVGFPDSPNPGARPKLFYEASWQIPDSFDAENRSSLDTTVAFPWTLEPSDGLPPAPAQGSPLDIVPPWVLESTVPDSIENTGASPWKPSPPLGPSGTETTFEPVSEPEPQVFEETVVVMPPWPEEPAGPPAPVEVSAPFWQVLEPSSSERLATPPETGHQPAFRWRAPNPTPFHNDAPSLEPPFWQILDNGSPNSVPSEPLEVPERVLILPPPPAGLAETPPVAEFCDLGLLALPEDAGTALSPYELPVSTSPLGGMTWPDPAAPATIPGEAIAPEITTQETLHIPGATPPEPSLGEAPLPNGGPSPVSPGILGQWATLLKRLSDHQPSRAPVAGVGEPVR